jgi:hypothetical protein
VLVVVVALMLPVIEVLKLILDLLLHMVGVVVVLLEILETRKQLEQVQVKLLLAVGRAHSMLGQEVCHLVFVLVVFKEDMEACRIDLVLIMMLEMVRVVQILVKIILFLVNLVQLKQWIEVLSLIHYLREFVVVVVEHVDGIVQHPMIQMNREVVMAVVVTLGHIMV